MGGEMGDNKVLLGAAAAIDLPDLPIGGNKSVQARSGDVIKTLNSTVIVDSLKDIVAECIKKGIVYDSVICDDSEQESLRSSILSLPADHSRRLIHDVIHYQASSGMSIIANKKQTDQVRGDITDVLVTRKSIYIEFSPLDISPSFINFFNVTNEQAKEVFEKVLGFGGNLGKSGISLLAKNNNPQLSPIQCIVDQIYGFAKKLKSYKLNKKYGQHGKEKDADLDAVIDLFEKSGINIVINLFNPLYSVSSNQDKKLDVEQKIAEIANIFSDTPFSIISTQVDLPDELKTSVSPHSWGKLKDITMDLPTMENYKERIRFIMGKDYVPVSFKNEFESYLEKNPGYLNELSSNISGIYMSDLDTHMFSYLRQNGKKSFDPKDLLDSFFKYRIESVKRLNSGALEINDENITFDDVGGLSELKRVMRNLGDLIAKGKASSIMKSYLLTGIPGTGKSLMCKAFRGEMEKLTGKKRLLLRFNISALFDKYQGNTEKNFREAVKVIDSLVEGTEGRVVLWIDEAEKALGGGVYSSNVDEKLLGEILNTFQDKWVYNLPTLGTVNDIDKLKAELLSRFIEKYFYDAPSLDSRKSILEIKLRKFGYDLSEEDFNNLLEQTDGFVGREIDGLFSKICSEISSIKEILLQLGKINEEDKILPTWKLIESIVQPMKLTIQVVAQKNKIDHYRMLGKVYTDPDKIKIKTDGTQSIGELMNLISIG